MAAPAYISTGAVALNTNRSFTSYGTRRHRRRDDRLLVWQNASRDVICARGRPHKNQARPSTRPRRRPPPDLRGSTTGANEIAATITDLGGNRKGDPTGFHNGREKLDLGLLAAERVV